MKFQSLILIAGIGALLLGVSGFAQKAEGKSQAERLFARAKEDDFMGDEGCAGCHAEKAANFKASPHAALVADSKLPKNKQGCEGCHGPGGIHQADENAEVISFRKMSPQESTAACLRCHAGTLASSHWKTTAHAKAGLACVTCHQIHPDSEPTLAAKGLKKGSANDTKAPIYNAKFEPRALLMASELVVCGQCHGPQAAEFRLATHHPVPEGRMECSDCHATHPTTKERTKKWTDRDACVKCHADFAGPFVFEHDPVAGHTGEGCVECHKPHGSHNNKMLNSFSRGVCAQCHTEKLSQHYPGQTCWNSGCHVAPHGSNRSRQFLEP